MNVDFADNASNLARMQSSLKAAAEAGAMLVIFPECALSGYCYESLDEAMPCAETIPGPATEALARACRERNAFAIFGLLEKDGERLFNTCALVGPDGLVASYRKVHLPSLGVDRFATPGDRPFAVHEIASLRVGMNICYDYSFPEASRVMMLQGADLIALPTNWPEGSRRGAMYLINARAHENHLYYFAVNRVGTERGFDFHRPEQMRRTHRRPHRGGESHRRGHPLRGHRSRLRPPETARPHPRQTRGPPHQRPPTRKCTEPPMNRRHELTADDADRRG